jgi:hypothetical protein
MLRPERTADCVHALPDRRKWLSTAAFQSSLLVYAMQARAQPVSKTSAFDIKRDMLAA